MSDGRASSIASGRRMSGPAQRAGRSERARGSAAQAPAPHPLEYQMYDTI